jgi:hypothetical protein
MAALGQDRRGYRDAERGHHMAERPPMVSAEYDHHVGVEPLDALGCRCECRAEAAPERLLDVALLARTVARADHQPF